MFGFSVKSVKKETKTVEEKDYVYETYLVDFAWPC